MTLVDRRALGLGLGAALVACLAVPALLPPYWIYLAITAVVSAVIMQSYGVIVGRAGVMSLCQMSFAAIGAWVVLRLNLADAPGGFLLWLLLGGLAAVPVGVAIGLPALRIRGVNLAIVTFGFAVSADIVLNANQFPGTTELKTLTRPSLFATNGAYFVLAVLVFTLLAVGLALFNRTRLGMSLLELRHSERAAASHGISVARSKLTAFAISSFIAGIGGGLMAGQLGLVVSSNFAMGQSLALFAVAILIGPHHPEGAVMGGVFGAAMATVMEKLKLPQDLGGMLFGLFAILALRGGVSQTDLTRGRRREAAARKLLASKEPSAPDTAPITASAPSGDLVKDTPRTEHVQEPAPAACPDAAPGGAEATPRAGGAASGAAGAVGGGSASAAAGSATGDGLPDDVARTEHVREPVPEARVIAAGGGEAVPTAQGGAAAGDAAQAGGARHAGLAVRGLRVRFGEVVALDGVDLTVPDGAVVGLIGPNGAGKSTFIAAVTGFVAGYEGTVTLAGQPIDRLAPAARARRGLRRTFQTTMIAPELTQYEYLTIGAGRRLPRREADELLEFFGCPPGEVPVSIVDVGTRRLLDVAAAVAARPRVALLDEPAAGQSAAESLKLGACLVEAPRRFGVSILLVEHDMELVRAACQEVTVLDFGHVIASGPTGDVLEDPAVMAAYLGAADVPVP
ncbi:ABC transporter permease subunit [Nonomuraea ceibae]|uniref:ABC transporter permease subunit n=1 Tax=Nonomuraea ceibae TaxID=1935170 RepID=UPI001FE5BF8E|nr:ATP-binding cassette domain-containing protein [Nonomuraea ceibae]